jgi:hypothetical protein
MDARLQALKSDVLANWQRLPNGTYARVKRPTPAVPAPTAKRVRQDPKPVLNGLETAWRDRLRTTLPTGTVIHEQAQKFKLANGAFYKPDMTACVAGKWLAWECKGGSKMKGVSKGMLALKVAATCWPEVQFILVWRDGQAWQTQVIYP